MKPQIIKHDSSSEFLIDERCYITEYENLATEGGHSLARARVERGVSTSRHKLSGVVERYIILKGTGLVEIGGLEPTEVAVGDIVVIPAEVNQRITNTGETDLLFLCLCLPGFKPECYTDTESID